MSWENGGPVVVEVRKVVRVRPAALRVSLVVVESIRGRVRGQEAAVLEVVRIGVLPDQLGQERSAGPPVTEDVKVFGRSEAERGGREQKEEGEEEREGGQPPEKHGDEG